MCLLRCDLAQFYNGHGDAFFEHQEPPLNITCEIETKHDQMKETLDKQTQPRANAADFEATTPWIACPINPAQQQRTPKSSLC